MSESGNIETDDDDEKIIDDGSEETMRVPHQVYKKNCNELIFVPVIEASR